MRWRHVPSGELRCGWFGWLGKQESPQGAGELTFEAADRFAVGLAFGELLLEVGTGGWMHADLRDRDAVQGGVELAVPAAVEAMTGAVARAGRDRGGAGDLRELRREREPLRAGGLTDRPLPRSAARSPASRATRVGTRRHARRARLGGR
jgi:hypothetical protein